MSDVNGEQRGEMYSRSPHVNGTTDTKAGPSKSGPFGTNAMASKADSSPAIEPPPQIDHITQGYQPLAKLVTRLVQETFNELRDVIEQLAEMPLPQSSSQTNAHAGFSHASSTAMTNGVNNSQVNVQKKMRLMKFVQDRRAQFIKVLVLAQWSRQSSEISRVIDLKVWLDRQRTYYDEAWYWMGDLKRTLGPAKMPNPDIHTALEVLSTGKASRMPDLGYVPPEPLTPQEMLRTLRNINTLLTFRLNLHETLPPMFRTFSIASGRATFVVTNEFEVDLSIADEDPSSQLYFIDFRFLFAPVGQDLPQGRLRDEVEGKVNDVLKREGLTGCYNFLHELVLSYKINILRRQAYEMARSKWTETIRPEMLRRTLVVAYWLSRPGAKSWLEIGVGSGRRKGEKGRPNGHRTSNIALRWFREGKEIKDSPITLDLANLSMERTLKNAMALHVTHIMTSIHSRLSSTLLYSRKTLALSTTISSSEPGDCALNLQLTSSRFANLIMEPITGRFALQPASPLMGRVEQDLNILRDPSADAHRPIANLRCWSASEEIEQRARFVGWEALKTLSPSKDDFKRIFSRETHHASYFRWKGWSRSWVVAVTFGMGGESWWIIELLSTPVGHTFGDHQQIPVSSVGSKPIDPTYDFLSRLEKMSASMISLYVNTRELLKANVVHSLTHIPSNASPDVHTPTLLVNFASLMARPKSWQPWAKNVLKLTFQSANSPPDHATLIAEARLEKPLQQDSLITDRVDDDIAFHPASGAFAFRLTTPVGLSIIAQLKERLQRVERLISFLDVIRRFNLACDTISLGRVVFTYGTTTTPPTNLDTDQSDPTTSLRADISFASETSMKLSLSPRSPHLRILDFLTELLNAPNTGLEHVTLLLGLTLPLLRAFDAIECAPVRTDTPAYVLPRSADWYLLRYTSPPCSFEIRLRQRRDDVKWFIRQKDDDTLNGRRLSTTNPPSNPPPSASAAIETPTSTANAKQDANPALTTALQALMNDSGPGWLGLRTGIAADIDGVPDAICRIDEVVTRFAGPDKLAANNDNEGGPTAAAATGEDGKNDPQVKREDIVVLD
ncbi:MAG: mediator complex subunit [Piccolia ochrophora]|nr:MAG: mediator complex subunit [Piccolia ochrophora]